MRRLLVLVVLLGVFFVWKTWPSRFTVLFYSDPIRVLVWNKGRGESVVVTIPESVVIPAVHGYGKYALSSLWKFGELDPKEESLLALSLSEVLGIPIKWYIGPNRTNVPFPLLFQMRLIPQKATIIDASLARREVVLPDNSTQQELDDIELDRILGNVFEVPRVREEAIPIAIYNTTKTPALGTRMARMIAHVGGNVLIVGNSTQTVSPVCVIVGKEETLKMHTAAFLAKELGCDRTIQRVEDNRVELSFFVGEGYAVRFSPQQPLPRE